MIKAFQSIKKGLKEAISYSKAGNKLRKNRDKDFKRMAKNNDDKLLDSESLSQQTSWDKLEWNWKSKKIERR